MELLLDELAEFIHSALTGVNQELAVEGATSLVGCHKKVQQETYFHKVHKLIFY